MARQRSSFRLCCVFCALLSGILWLLLAQGWLNTPASAQDKPATIEKPKETEKPKADDADDADPPKDSKRYQYRRDHDIDGIGKFYMGREIAHVMGFQAAPWLERPKREEEERLNKLVKLLNLKPGMVVADVGAGSGVISIMMAHEVGAEGKVIAVDIQKEMLQLLGEKLSHINVKNVELVLGTEKSPKLKAESVDLAIMVDVYHEFRFPFEMIEELSKALKPGGRVAFVEYRREDPDVPIKLVHKMSEAQVKKEISQPEFGLKWKETIPGLPRQHIVVFEKPVKTNAE